MPAQYQTVPLFSRRRFAFSTLGAGEALEWVMARAAKVEYGDATLLVRVHEATVDNDSRVLVSVRTTAPTAEEPETEFVAAEILASATIDASVDAATLLADSLTGDLGGYVQVVVRGERVGGSDTVVAVLSADLVVREGGSRRSLAATLAAGNVSGGRDVVLTDGSVLRGADSPEGAAEGLALRGGDASSSGDGGTTTIRGGNASGSGSSGGDVTMQGGAPGSGNVTGARVDVEGGAGSGSSAGGAVELVAGQGGATGIGGVAVIAAGAGGTTSGRGGHTTVRAGHATTSGLGGFLFLLGGDAAGSDQTGGTVTVAGGKATGTGAHGSVNLRTGHATPLRAFTFAAEVSVSASSSVDVDLISGADDITLQNTGAFVDVRMMARWGTGTSTRAAIHYERYYNRSTGNAFSNLLRLDAASNSGTVYLSAVTGALTNLVRVTINNDSGSAVSVRYAATVTLHSTEQPIT